MTALKRAEEIADRVFPWKTNPIKFAELAEEIRRAIILHKYAGSHPSTIDETMQHCAVTDFLETWGAHCGAPKKVFAGHVREMLRELMAETKPAPPNGRQSDEARGPSFHGGNAE